MAEFGNNFDISKFDPSSINWEALNQAANPANYAPSASVPDPVGPAKQVTTADGSTFTVPYGFESGGFNPQGLAVLQPKGTAAAQAERAAAAPAVPAGPSAADIQAMIDKAIAADRAAATSRKNDEAKAILSGTFRQWGGMEGVISDLDALIREWGNNIDVILAKIPETETYKTRFKGLVDLRKKGITDIQNEGQYLSLEKEYRSVFREAGMRDFLGVDGTQSQFDSIAELVADYSVSVNEVRSRVNDAARVVADTSSETLTSLQEFYGLDVATLTEYVLDPIRTQNKINTLANAALLGGGARRSNLNIDVSTAESLAGLSGDQDANIGSYQDNFSQAAVLRDATERLAAIEESDISDSEIVQSQFGIDATAIKKVKGLQSRERARFAGASGVSSSSLASNSG